MTSRMVAVPCLAALTSMIPFILVVNVENQQAGEARVVLAEVLYDPRPGEVAFVEIFNVGTAPADVSKMALQIGDAQQVLGRVAAPLAPGARLVIRFDGEGRSEPGVLHASKGIALPAAGEIALRGSENGVVDRVAWGGAPGSVSLGAGSLTRLADVRRVPGRSIGRPPGANLPDMRSEWTAYPPGSATPGAANRLPRIAQLMPIDGAELSGAVVDLAWYPEPGTVRYRVQVARDTTFATPVVEVIVDEAGAETPRLPPGRYVWRVEAIASDGTRAGFSDPATFDLLASTETDNEDQQGRVVVRFLPQHKDSPLLQLENPRYKEPHGWDANHKGLARFDKSDTKNCLLANVAMVNHFYEGDLTQDRIGYEVLSDAIDQYRSVLANGQFREAVKEDPAVAAELREVKPGPEWDFTYGVGITPVRGTAALMFALGVEPTFRQDYAGAKEELWRDVVAEIDAGRPIVAAGLSHTYTITGYSSGGGRRRISLNDPARSPYTVDFDVWAGRPENISTWIIPPGARGRRLERAAIDDSDDDGVKDFDEVRRFKTDPSSKDSDRDGVQDKEDIASGVFEREFQLGYAFGPSPTGESGRDYDEDGLPTERDPDSDNGGCLDGEEDLDGDGFRTGSERSNFGPSDDACGRINGTLTYRVGHTMSLGPQVSTESLSVSVSVRVKADPSNPGTFVDDGSRFAMRSITTLTVSNPGCTMTTRSVARAGGAFSDSTRFSGTLSPDGLVMDAVDDVGQDDVVDICISAGTGRSRRSFGLRECVGKVSGRPADGVYVFNCNDVPPPANGVTVHVQSLTGRVRLARESALRR